MNELRGIFDEDAALYDRARPGYPDELFTDLVELTGLGPGHSVIEIGPGTGQATWALAAAGAAVTAVELGAQLAAVLRANLPGVTVVNAAFEDWLPPAPADLVTSFTAWHWVDADRRAGLVHRALPVGGYLATVATEHVRGGTVDFFEQAQECYLRWGPATDAGQRLVPPDELAPITDEIDSSPLFGSPIRRRYVRDLSYSADAYLDVLRTYPGHRALPEAARTGLLTDLRSLILDNYQGVITKTYLHELRIARAR